MQTGDTLIHGATIEQQRSIKSHAVNQQNAQMKMPPRPYKSFEAPKPPT